MDHAGDWDSVKTTDEHLPHVGSEAAGHRTVDQLACCRESPRPCVNQDLVNQLAPLRLHRFLKYGGTSVTVLARTCTLALESATVAEVLRDLRAFGPGAPDLVKEAQPTTRKSISYAAAVSVLIGTPFRITSVEQARHLPKVCGSRGVVSFPWARRGMSVLIGCN